MSRHESRPIVANVATLPDSIARRIFWRTVPILFFVYVLNYLDRANVGIAALQMNAALGFGPDVYGTGAGIFLIAYLLAGVPSNLLVLKFGARGPLGIMMVAWGLASAATALAWDARSFFAVRFLLGVAEAGFVPAVMLYLSAWFPQTERGRAVGAVSTATVTALVIGSPLSGALLEVPNWLGIAPWRWLFIIEGLGTVVLALVIFRYLPERPRDSPWLSPQQLRELTEVLEQEQKRHTRHTLSDAWAAFCNRRLWALFGYYSCVSVGFVGMVFWLPLIIHRLAGLRPLQIGLLSAIPFLFSAVGMVWGGRHSDQTGRRYPYLILCPLIGAAGFAISGLLSFAPFLSIAALVIAMGVFSALIGPFWSLTTSFLRGSAAAVGIGVVTAGSSIGGFVGVKVLGELRQRSGDFASGLYAVAAFLLTAALIMGWVAHSGQRSYVAAAREI